MFEYMMMGIPVIVSNFPLWSEIVAASKCGYALDPLDLDAIEAAVRGLLDEPERAVAMGQRGRAAVMERYNWEGEARNMAQFYRQLLS